jgi:hypothetical protein
MINVALLLGVLYRNEGALIQIMLSPEGII